MNESLDACMRSAIENVDLINVSNILQEHYDTISYSMANQWKIAAETNVIFTAALINIPSLGRTLDETHTFENRQVIYEILREFRKDKKARTLDESKVI